MTTVNTARRRVGAVAVFVILGITACSDDSTSSSVGDEPTPTAPGAIDSAGGSLGGGEATEATGTDPAPLTPVTLRKLVITMSVGLEVTDAAAAVDAVVRLAADHDGQLYDSSVDLGDPRYAGGDLVFKLPPDEVDGFLTGLYPASGRRTSLHGDTHDVTDQLSARDALTWFRESGYLMLDVTSDHAAQVESLPDLHADPFDRMLVAQAVAEPLRLLTRDAAIARYSDTIILV